MYLDDEVLENTVNVLSLSELESVLDKCILEFLQELRKYRKTGLTPKQVGELKNREPIGLSASCRNTRKVMENIDWKEVQSAVDRGEAGKLFPVGTEIRTELKNGKTVSFVVAALDHYQKGELVFVSRNCIGKDQPVNFWDEERGWARSDLRDYLNKDLVKLLPDDLLSVVSTKKTVQVSAGNLESSEDLLFLPSVYEVFGEAGASAYNGTDKQYPYYAEEANRIVVDEKGYRASRWLCSPCDHDPSCYYYVDFYGLSGINRASFPLGVVPGFVIRARA